LPYSVTFCIAIIYFMYYDITLGIGLLIMVVAFSWSCLMGPVLCKDIALEAAEEANELNEQIDDDLRNLISIYSQDQKVAEVEKLEPFEAKVEKSFEKAMKCSVKIRVWTLPIILIFLAVFIYRCYTMIRDSTMKVSVFVSLFIMLLYVLSAMITLTEQVRDLIFDIGVISGFDAFYAKSLDKESRTNTNTNTQSDKMGLYIDNVSFTYPGSSASIIENLNLHIKSGEKLGILGDIGSGKSTVEKLILKLNLPSTGNIYFNGRSYNDMSIKEIRRRIGYVPQNPVLFNRTVLENIRYGNEKSVSEQDIINLLNDLNLMQEFDSLETGIHTKVGKNGSKLSGGQRQAVNLLRILLTNPEVLVLDEPTSSLDEKTKKVMEKLFDVIMQNRTVILVTHDDYLKKYATRTISMTKGQIVSDETTH